MRVFKYLVALADIAVAFLGFFFIIFAITRPTLTSTLEDNKRLEQANRELQQRIRQLQEIDLNKVQSGETLNAPDAADIVVEKEAVRVRYQNRNNRYATVESFLISMPEHNWPAHIVFYVDRHVPFDVVVRIVDALKKHNEEVVVKIAALPQ